MGSHTIHIENQSSKPRRYILCLDNDLDIWDSIRGVLSPEVESGASYDFVISDKYYVWAKLTDNPRDAILEVDVGSAVVLKAVGGEPAISKASGTPKPGCFSITIDPSFLGSGVFGLGINVLPSVSFRRLSSMETDDLATYNIEPSKTFRVEVNDRYKDGDDLRRDGMKCPSVVIDFQKVSPFVRVSHRRGVAEELSISEEPMQMKDLQTEIERLERERKIVEEREKEAAVERERQAAMEKERKRQAAERERQAAIEKERQRQAAERERQAAAERERQAAAERERQRQAAERERQRQAAEWERQRQAAEWERQRQAAERERQAAAERERQAAAERERQRQAANQRGGIRPFHFRLHPIGCVCDCAQRRGDGVFGNGGGFGGGGRFPGGW